MEQQQLPAIQTQTQPAPVREPTSTKTAKMPGITRLQTVAGNRAVGQLIQARLEVSRPDDAFEQEADRVADQVMRMAGPSPAVCCGGPAPDVQRACTECEEEAVQAKSHGGPAPGGGPAPAARINSVLSRPGASLPDSTRSFMESRFGCDFGSVRIHSDETAADAAASLNARAFTRGNHVVFGRGQYSPGSEAGRWLLAHEFTHVIQQSRIQTSPVNLVQRAAGGGGGAGSATTGGGATAGGGGSPSPGGLAVDVLASEAPEDFLVRAAARDLGVDIRVSSMNDMISQLESRASGSTCISSLDIFNHGNPSIQTVAGGNKVKTAEGGVTERPLSGFSLSWLFDNTNQAALNRLRGTFCCNNAIVNWYGCSTAGVWAEGGRRTDAERRENERRYSGVFGSWYHDIDEAAAHGASNFRYLGLVNAQSWSNALCAPITAATDFTNWRTAGSDVIRTVIHGGRQVRVNPEAAAACSCDAETGRFAGSAPTPAQLRTRADELRGLWLGPLYERTRGVLGTAQAPQPETEAERATRLANEQAQTASLEQLGNTIRDAVLATAGFAAGTRPATADEALRVVALWGLDIDRIVAALPTLTTALSGMLRGTHEESGLDQTQRALEAALSQRGRESFMAALMSVRQEPFWNDYLLRNTVYIFPDLTGVNRYRGFTQVATRTVEGSRPQTVFVIHVSKDLLESGQTEMVAANIVHELSHSTYENRVGRAMQAFETDLAELIADHPRVVSLRSGAADAAAARSTHVSRIRQMLYEVTGYAEEEIFVHLQQLTHQPSMTIDGAAVRGSDFILSQVELYMRRLRRIGMPPRVLTQVLAAIRREAAALYDRRIASQPAGSSERRILELNKEMAMGIFQIALSDSERPPATP
jgi:hypothetical protein